MHRQKKSITLKMMKSRQQQMETPWHVGIFQARLQGLRRQTQGQGKHNNGYFVIMSIAAPHDVDGRTVSGALSFSLPTRWSHHLEKTSTAKWTKTEGEKKRR